MSEQVQCVETAMRQCERRLIGYLYAKFRDLELARDEAQKAFIALAAEDCPSIQNKAGWLITVSYRNTLRTIRKERPKEHVPDKMLEHLPEPKVCSPDEAAIISERHSELFALLDTLTDKQREVVRLIYFGGLKPGEVAELLKEKPNNIHALHFAALRTLRGRLIEMSKGS